MATYSTIKGFTIQSFATDPYVTPAAAGTWASGGAMNTGRYTGGSAGTATAAVVGGGYPPTVNTETYDGTSWTEVANFDAVRSDMAQGVGGTQTAAIACMASPSLQTEANLWNGTSWTEVADLAAATGGTIGGGGTNALGLSFGGFNPSSTAQTATEEFTRALAVKTVTVS